MRAPEPAMPKSLARTLFPAQESSRSITGKGKSGIRRQHSCARASRAKFMGPANLARLVVDRLQHALAPEPIIRARPTVRPIRRFVEIDAVGGVSIDDKQAGLRIEAGRAVVGQATLVRCNQAPVGRRFLGRVWNRDGLACLRPGPVHGPEGNGEQALAIGPIQNEKIAVA
jgi:hypothetical protein